MLGEPCDACKKPIDHEARHITAYHNSKPVYSSFCKACIKEYWLRFKEQNPNLWSALNEKK